MTKSDKHFRGGNVFQDLGFDEIEAEELLIKAHLFHKLQDAIRATKQTQAEVAEILGTDQSKVSKILRGQMSQFSVDRITSYLLHLGWDIHIDAHPSRRGTGRGKAIVRQEKSLTARVLKPTSPTSEPNRSRRAKASGQ